MGTVQTGDFGAPTLFSQCQIPEIWLEKGFESMIEIMNALKMLLGESICKKSSTSKCHLVWFGFISVH